MTPGKVGLANSAAGEATRGSGPRSSERIAPVGVPGPIGSPADAVTSLMISALTWSIRAYQRPICRTNC